MGTPLSLKVKLHQYIEVADEQKLQALYVLLEDEINRSYNTEEIGMFHQRRENHLNGNSKSYKAVESLNISRGQAKHPISS